ncbi:MAG TPA: C25 family cysteine peptidase [Clostridiales bacterium]|nr:C25 family cysteine peptidase [Clostridiales bacterium]HQP70177.1 C25 family cysteine peptidase [Clostridiales bacterium]
MKQKTNLIIAVLLISAATFAAVTEHTYYFSSNELKQMRTADGYDLIQLPGTMNTAKTGEPALPYASVSLMLPPGEKAVSVEIFPTDKIELEGKYNIYPQQHVRPYSAGGSGIFVKNEKLYSDDSVFPEEKNGQLITEFMNGRSFALTSFTPAEYRPLSQELSLYSKVTVRITSAPDKEAAAALENLINSDVIEKALIKADHNGGMNSKLYSKQLSKGEAYDLLIITGAAYTDSFSGLAEFYLQRGLKTKIVSTSDIYASSTGSDNPEKIRNFVISEYQNSGIEFVLLGGDVEIVPPRGFYCEVQSSELYTDNFIPADIYYSSLDGTWNIDGDTKWGEPDEDDLLPEVSVARLPFSDTTELGNMLNKTMNYQANPVTGELRSPLLVGEKLYDDPETWGGDYMDMLIGFKTDNGYVTRGIPLSHDIVKLYDEGTYEWSFSELLTEMNSGHPFVHHDGHSNYTYNMRMDNGDVTNTNFSGLNGTSHNYTNIYSSGCMSGGFDTSDCIGERFVAIENCAVSYVGNSRYGWFNEGQTEGPSIHIHREFMDALYGDRTAEIGKAHKESKNDTAPWITAPGQWEQGAIRWCFYDCNVLGDPLMSIWTDEPEALAVTKNDSITFGDATYQVVVKGTGNQALSNIRCAILQNGQLIGSAKTNSSGVAVITLQNSYALGTAGLNVSGLNTILTNYQIEIVPSSGAYMIVDSWSVNSGGDDMIEFGETADISVTVTNAGLTDAEDLSMEITESDDMISLNNSSFFIGNVAGESSSEIISAFSFNVAENIPDMYEFTLNTRIYDATKEWTGSQKITAMRPVFEITGVVVSAGGDNVLDPGESGDIVVTIVNNGHGKALDLNSVLSSPDDRIMITSDSQQNSVILPGESTDLIFSVTAADASSGYSSEFHLNTTGDSGFDFEDGFYISIGTQREDFETGGFTKFNWYFEGDKTWTSDASQVYAGSYSARSGAISNNETSTMYTICDVVNPGDLSFYYWTSTEANYDALSFYMDGTLLKKVSGISSGWKFLTFAIPEGEHIFKWTYKKDGSAYSGEDCVRIDNIMFPGMINLTSIKEDETVLPVENILYQNYPNPFNPSTEIVYSLSSESKVSLNVYNLKGELVKELVNGNEQRGNHRVLFSAENMNSGLYFYSLSVNGVNAGTKRMLIIK